MRRDQNVGILRIDPRASGAKTRPTSFPTFTSGATMSAQLAEVLPLSVSAPAARGLILHVDDDDGMRRSTALLLRVAGFETREASSGEQALEPVELLRGKLDVLIVDYHLGNGMTGTEVAEELARLLGHAVPTVDPHRRPRQCRSALAIGCACVAGAQAASCPRRCSRRCPRWWTSAAPWPRRPGAATSYLRAVRRLRLPACRTAAHAAAASGCPWCGPSAKRMRAQESRLAALLRLLMLGPQRQCPRAGR